MNLKEQFQDLQTIFHAYVRSKQLKKLGGFLLVCAILGSGGAWYHHQQKIAEHAKLAEARTVMIQAQAKQDKITLLDKSAIQSLTASAIGVNEKDITYKEIALIDLQQEHHEKKEEEKDHPREKTPSEQTASFQPIYKVSCQANQIKYHVVLNAITGKILHSEVD